MNPYIIAEMERRGLLHAEQQARPGVPGPALSPAVFQLDAPLTTDQMLKRLKLQGAGQTPPGSLEDRLEPAQFEDVGQQLQAVSLTNQLVSEGDLKHVALANSAQVNTLPNQAFLREIFIEGTIIRKMATQLFFLDMINRNTVTTSEIVWYREAYGNHNDPLLKQPRPIDEGAEFTETLVSDPNKKHASTAKWGLAVEFTDRAIRNTNTAFNEVSRKIDAVSYALAYKFNKIFADVIGNEFNAGVNAALPADDQVNFSTVINTWDDPGATPIDDILDLALTMEEDDEWFFRPSELWLPPKSWTDLYKYFISVDHDAWVQRPQDGMPMTMQVADIMVRKAPTNSGIPDGNGLMLARGPGVAPPLDVFEEVDGRFTRSGDIHVQRIFEERTLNVRFQLWRTFVAVNRNPHSVGVFAGLR